MKCYASDYCQKDKSSCSDVCGGYRVLRALYNLSRIPERYRYTIALKPENGEDLEAFTTLDNYKNILTQKPFLRWFYNSAVLSFFTMVIAIGFAMVSSYAFSRYRFKGRNGILKLLLLLNAFPQILSMFALFRLLKQMNMLDTKLGLVIIYAGSMCIFSIWNMKGYFDTIPIEIEEASKIDGASDFQLLWKVVMPLARPAIIVTSVMVLIFVWNEYLFSTTFLLNENSYTLAGGL